MTDTHLTQWVVTEEPFAAPGTGKDRRSRLSIALVTLPDGVQSDQVVVRVHPAVMCVLVDEQARVLMLRRHRFIADLWMWELPGGYLDPGEDPAACAARKAEEETGWRPGRVEHLCSFQPMTGTADALNHVYLGRDPQRVHGERDVNEAADTAWIALADVPGMIRAQVLGAASVTGLLAARDALGVG